ncbi:hypothetical protein NU195Hw_Modified_547t1 [Hortaea werneckii]
MDWASSPKIRVEQSEQYSFESKQSVQEGNRTIPPPQKPYRTFHLPSKKEARQSNETHACLPTQPIS